MREFVLAAPHTIAFRDYDEPPLRHDQVRVRSIVSGIKHGTEMALYQGNTPFIEKEFDLEYRLFRPRDDQDAMGFYPTYLGSWLVGEVIEVGAAVMRFKVGDLVHGGMPHRPTHVVAAERLYSLKADMAPETALFTDPTIFALGAAHDAQIKVGDDIAIFGMGAIGLLALQIARLSGAERVFAVDLINERLELAMQFGADAVFNPQTCDPALEIKIATEKHGVDVSMEISGAYPALQTAIRSIRPAGLIITASYYKGRQPIEMGAEWHHNRPTMVSSMPVWGMPHRCYPLWDRERLQATAVRLLESDRLITQPMIGARFNFEDAAEAYRMIDAHPERSIKTLFDYY
jgi:threonine dehydrogenase-like Zn-dependent dehydrogenase